MLDFNRVDVADFTVIAFGTMIPNLVHLLNCDNAVAAMSKNTGQEQPAADQSIISNLHGYRDPQHVPGINTLAKSSYFNKSFHEMIQGWNSYTSDPATER